MDPWNGSVNDFAQMSSSETLFQCRFNRSILYEKCAPINNSEWIFIERPQDMLEAGSQNPAFLTIIITHAVTFFIGVIGNFVVILTWAGGGKLRSPTTAFLVSLAASDLLLLLVYVPLEILEYFALTWEKLGSVCKLSSYVEMLCGTAAVLNLVAVSIERFLVIVYPMKARRLCTLSTSRKGLLFVWFSAIVFAIPLIFAKQVFQYTYYNDETSVTVYYCFDDSNDIGKIIAIYQFSVMFLFPAIIMVICYFCVIQELWVSTKTMASMTKNSSSSITNTYPRSSESSRASISTRSDYQIKWPSNRHERMVYPKHRSHGFQIRQARKQVIKMLIFVVVIFFFCWGPRLVLNILLKFEKDLKIEYDHKTYTIRITCYLLSFIHSALNPFIYGFMSSNFRKMMCSSCSSHTTGNTLSYTLNSGSCSIASNHHHIIGCVRSSLDDSIIGMSSKLNGSSDVSRSLQPGQYLSTLASNLHSSQEIECNYTGNNSISSNMNVKEELVDTTL